VDGAKAVKAFTRDCGSLASGAPWEATHSACAGVEAAAAVDVFCSTSARAKSEHRTYLQLGFFDSATATAGSNEDKVWPIPESLGGGAFRCISLRARDCAERAGRGLPGRAAVQGDCATSAIASPLGFAAVV
jgi:hypothetical protein